MPVLVVLCTCPASDAAESLAATLVERRLAACVNLLPGVRSVYRWQGTVAREDETLLLIKTTREQFDALRDCIVSIHPHAVPEVIGLDVVAGFQPYLDWVREQTAVPGAPA
jgi:periplasmic divalent cation tolerance protein